MVNTIKILVWNANGLLNHQQELQLVLQAENIDVCLISETHFTTHSFIKIYGYKIYHAAHPDNDAKGGSAVIIKENMQHYEEPSYISEKMQVSAVTIKTNRYPLTIAGIYCPPRHAIKKEEYYDLFACLGNRFIIGGDLNAKNTHWGSRLTTTKGRELLKAVNEYGATTLSTGKPTYWPTDPNKIPDLIDFFIIKSISSNYLKIDECEDLFTDHSAIILTLSENIIQKENNHALVNKYTDWINFKHILEEKINLNIPLKTEEALEKEVEKFNKDIQTTAWECTPIIKRRLKGCNYPKEIRMLVSNKRKARRKWFQSRAPQDKTILNNLTQQLKRVIKEFKEESISSYLSELTNDCSTDYSLWKATKRLKRPVMQIPPIKKDDGTWARSSEQKAECFASHLETIFQPHNLQEEEELLEETIPQDELVPSVSLKEVIKEIKHNINPKKAPGFDLITGEILRQLPRKALVKLTHIINAVIRLKYVPALWKVAEIVMVPKPGKPPHVASSYRPISLLPIMSKLFEKLLLKRMQPIIEIKNLIPNHQFGFRHKHSTIDQLHRVTNIIENALEERNVCSVIFLDVAQAFDKVWHEGLFHKLNSTFPKQYTDIIKSYLTDRHFRIKQDDAYSDLKEIKAGVPQGSVLGPVLYLLYTYDLPELDNNTVATFADDTAIIAVGKDNTVTANSLQSAINKFQNWTNKWKLKLNESKSVHIDFTNKRIEHVPINMNGQDVPYANTAKYLGLTLDAKLRWKAHVKKKREELGIRYKKMYWLLGRYSALSTHNKLLIYKQVLKPVWTYGIQLWGCTKQSNIKIIQTFQNKVLRGIVNAPWYIRNEDLHRDLKMEYVDKVIQKNARSHEGRLHQHDNIEAIQLLDNLSQRRRLKRIKPHELV